MCQISFAMMLVAVTAFCAIFVCVYSTRVPTLMPRDDVKSPNNCGNLRRLENAHLLQLSGSPFQRGFAHGFLLSAQIIDWLYFYQFQYNMKGDVGYYNEYALWLSENQFVSPTYQDEVVGMYDGMKASNISLYIEEFDRDINLVDLFVINSYLEGTPVTGARRIVSSGSLKMNSFHNDGGLLVKNSPACTQFVCWGPMTTSGETLSGRNMDGETDPWFVTVTHLLIISVEPTNSEELRIVSVMWPGHIGTLSAMNEDGVSAMLNCGLMGPGELATNITAIEWTIRDVISHTRGRDAAPATVLSRLNQFRGSQGGVSAAGSVIVFATPNSNSNSAPGFVAELDRYGGLMRTAQPNMTVLYQSNHFVEYGVVAASEDDPVNPAYNFGLPVGFSSRWRLEAVRGVLDTVNRSATSECISDKGGDSCALAMDLRLGGLAAAAQVMRAPSHGWTEHSIVFAPTGGLEKHTVNAKPSSSSTSSLSSSLHRPRFAVANAQPTVAAGMWDAPYQRWVEYDFDDMFN